MPTTQERLFEGDRLQKTAGKVSEKKDLLVDDI